MRVPPTRPQVLATALASLATVALALPLAACSTSDEASTAAPTTAPSPTGPVLQPGRPGEANASLTGTAAAPRPKPPVDPDDVRFLQDMIVHHAQAITMVQLAKDHLTDKQVKALASRIADEQEPEIAYMARLLRERGQGVPPQADNPSFGANDHSAHGSMKGMASPAELKQLAAARGVESDRLWLRLMTRHHEGALSMVLDQLRDGSDDVVSQMSDEIHVTQQTQINHMQGMLGRLS